MPRRPRRPGAWPSARRGSRRRSATRPPGRCRRRRSRPAGRSRRCPADGEIGRRRERAARAAAWTACTIVCSPASTCVQTATVSPAPFVATCAAAHVAGRRQVGGRRERTAGRPRRGLRRRARGARLRPDDGRVAGAVDRDARQRAHQPGGGDVDRRREGSTGRAHGGLHDDRPDWRGAPRPRPRRRRRSSRSAGGRTTVPVAESVTGSPNEPPAGRIAAWTIVFEREAVGLLPHDDRVAGAVDRGLRRAEGRRSRPGRA